MNSEDTTSWVLLGQSADAVEREFRHRPYNQVFRVSVAKKRWRKPSARVTSRLEVAVITRRRFMSMCSACLVGLVIDVESDASDSGEPRRRCGRQRVPRTGQCTHASDDDRHSVAVHEVTGSRVNVNIQGRQCFHAAAEIT